MSSELDALLARVEDPALRDDLRRQIDLVRAKRSFGLVFESHLPERVRLPSYPVRRGSSVVLRDGSDERSWTVEGVTSKKATIVREDEELAVVAVSDLVVVAEFGEPVYPGLRHVGSVHRGGDKPAHVVINGENHHALEALQFTHAGKVDCIYIDPPYNTGAKDWKYNNDYVDRDDHYRHSKWLAFMERRLKLAKDLLNPANSVLIVTIDENEVHRVGLLLQQLFPGSKIQMVTVLINPAGASIIDQFSRVDEHMFFVHIGAARPIRTTADTTPGTSTFVTADGEAKPFTWESFLRSGGNSRRQDTKAKFFPVWIDPVEHRIIGCGDHLPPECDRADAPPPPSGAVEQWPLKTDGTEACWQTSAPTFRQYLDEGRIKLGRRNKKSGRFGISFLPKGAMRAIADGELVVDGRDEQGSLIVRNAEGRVRSQVAKTMWTNVSYSATEYGSTLLRSFIPGRAFPFPKSLYAVEDALRCYVGDKPEALVLDFFAGSGTTAHALMRLNRQDGGQRQCVLVTNNEVSTEDQKRLLSLGLQPGDPEWEALGICNFITKPRIESVVTGRTPDGEPIRGDYKFTDEFPMSEGFEENVEFFELTYQDGERVELDLAFEAIAPLLWLRAGATGPVVTDPRDSAGRRLPYEFGTNYAVLFNSDRWRSFIDRMTDEICTVFIVTDSATTFATVAAELPTNVEPVRLYRNYLSTFEINRGLGA
jgi:adenine-specific DNA-methyltransferase